MHKRTVSIFLALALVAMGLPFIFTGVLALDNPPVFGSDNSDTAATTGDAFDFEINITDDFTITNTYVIYWFGSGTSTNASMTTPTGAQWNWTYQITIPTGSTDMLYYMFSTVDNATQWTHFPSALTNVSVAVTDNDAPVITDSSPTTGTTGDGYTFDVAVTDNIGVNSVTITWSHGGSSGTNVAMTDDLDGTYSLAITLDHSLSSMTYTVTADDAAANSITTSSATVTVTDNDNPTMTDNSAAVGTTGDSYLFDVVAADNVALSGVAVSYGHNTVTGANVAMVDDLDGTFSLAITLDHSTANLVYTIVATDTSSNTVSAGPTSATVNDNDPPMVTDSSPTTGTTGDSYTFDVAVTDNIGVNSVTLTWSHGTLSGTNVAMTNDMDGTYSLTITLDDSTSTMSYTIYADDGAGNSITTTATIVTVTDNDPPSLDADNSLGTGTTGDSYTFDITASDNIDVTAVTVTWSHGSLSGTNVAMTDDLDGTWSLSISLDDAISSMTYTVTVSDGTNSVSGSQQTVTVTDNDNPTFTDNSLTTGTTGDSYMFDVTASDNVAIASVIVTWAHGTLSGTAAALTDDLDGTYSMTITLDNALSSLTYTLTVRDTSGNVVVGSLQTITVTDNDAPTFAGPTLNPNPPTTGDSLSVSVVITDNIALGTANPILHYNMGLGWSVISNPTSVGSTFTFSLTAHSDGTSISYYFTAVDSSGNTGTSTTWMSSITDNDNPALDADNSMTSGTTGDSFILDITASDNVQVGSVRMDWAHGSLSGSSIFLNSDGDGTYSYTLNLDHATSSMTYTISVYDTSSNFVMGSQQTVSVTDNDAPTFEGDMTGTPATTGDSFTFSVEIDDNIDGANVNSASLLYAYGADWSTGTGLTLAYNNGNGYWEATITVADTLSSIYYNVTARDVAGNSDTWSGYIRPVMDNDAPTIDTDTTASAGTTGDPFNFTMTASDNIDVRDVYVSYAYLGGNSYNMLMMTSTGTGGYYLVVNMEDTLSPMSYNFTVIDTSTNDVTGSNVGVAISDNDNPWLFSDMSAKEAEAGRDFDFKIMAKDNIGVSSVTVEYWFSFNSQRTSIPLSVLSDDVYFASITPLPAQPGEMYYIFNSQDTSGNAGSTSEETIEVLDITPPVIEGVVYEEYAYTGNDFVVTAMVTDDVEVDWVRMYYYYGEEMGVPDFVEGVASGSDYSFTISIPDDLAPLNFWLGSVDMEMNLVELDPVMIEVMDDDLPMVAVDLSDMTATTGDAFMLKLNVSDNIAIGSVDAHIMYPGSDWEMMSMMVMDMTYYLDLTMPNDEKGMFSYYFSVYDTSMNMVETTQVDLEVMDDEEPIAMILGPMTAYQHEMVEFSAMDSMDNVGIETYVWEINGESLSGMDVNYTFDDVGEYTIELKVSDGANPTVSYSYNITIMDADDPVIVMDIEDEIGNHLMLVANASLSTDNVGIVSYSWLLILPDNTRITGSGEIFEFDLVDSPLGNLTLYLTIADEMDNMASEMYPIVVVDVLPPVVIAPDDVTAYEGAYLKFIDDRSMDNVGMSEWIWHISFGELDVEKKGQELSYFFETPGRYNITLTVVDSKNNSASDYFYVNIDEKGLDYDTDGDMMPDWWEEEKGLDKNVNDAQRDYDGDLLTNFVEFQLGTNPKSSDSDGDGLPDNYEKMYAYEDGKDDIVNGVPRWMDDFKGTDDTDGDGDSNLQEYLEGNRDPTMEDSTEKATDNTILYIIIIVVIIVLIMAIIIGLIILIGKIKPVEEVFPEGQYPHLYKNVETAPAPEAAPADPPVQNN